MCKDMIIEWISEFSDKYLDEELKNLNIKLAHKLSGKVSFSTDSPEMWAGGIIYAVGQLNFLFDYEIKPYIDRDLIPYYFSADPRKISLKARDIRRLLKLKLGDEEFSTEAVLSLNIPENDNDLKRIRLLSEVKRQILPRPPVDEDFLRNRELERLFDRISNEKDGEKYFDEIYPILRWVYLITLKGEEDELVQNEGDGFKFLFFTSMKKCSTVLEEHEDLKPKLWAFFNIKYYINNEDFRGIILNPGSDDIMLTKEMVSKVYPYPEKIDYTRMYY